jgi:hypothetical protein
MTLVKASLGDEVIILKIGGSTCQFDTSADALAVLKAGGVSDGVIRAMIEATARRPAAAGPEAAPVEPKASPVPPVGTQFPLFHFVTGGAWHFGVLTMSHDRLTWTETAVGDYPVARKTAGFIDPTHIDPGDPDDDFDVACSEVLDVGNNKAVVGEHVHLRTRTYNLAPAVKNKDGKFAPKGNSKISGLDQAIAEACPGVVK